MNSGHKCYPRLPPWIRHFHYWAHWRRPIFYFGHYIVDNTLPPTLFSAFGKNRRWFRLIIILFRDDAKIYYWQQANDIEDSTDDCWVTRTMMVGITLFALRYASSQATLLFPDCCCWIWRFEGHDEDRMDDAGRHAQVGFGRRILMAIAWAFRPCLMRWLQNV